MLLLLDEMSATNPDEDTNQGEDEAGKSQRKRERERQRRTEMAGAFNDLSQLLHELDPDNADSFSGSRRRRRRGSDGDEFDLAADGSGMTRLLLINRATEMLRTLRTENINLRHRLQMAGGADDKNVYVMVPTLQPVDDQNRPAQPNSSNPLPSQNAYFPPHPDTSQYGQAPGNPNRPSAEAASHHSHYTPHQHPPHGQHPNATQYTYYQNQYYAPPFSYSAQGSHPPPAQPQQSVSPTRQSHPSGPPSGQGQPQPPPPQPTGYQVYSHWPAPAQGMVVMQQQPAYGGAPLPPSGNPSVSGSFPSHPPAPAPP